MERHLQEVEVNVRSTGSSVLDIKHYNVVTGRIKNITYHGHQIEGDLALLIECCLSSGMQHQLARWFSDAGELEFNIININFKTRK